MQQLKAEPAVCTDQQLCGEIEQLLVSLETALEGANTCYQAYASPSLDLGAEELDEDVVMIPLQETNLEAVELPSASTEVEAAASMAEGAEAATKAAEEAEAAQKAAEEAEAATKAAVEISTLMSNN